MVTFKELCKFFRVKKIREKQKGRTKRYKWLKFQPKSERRIYVEGGQGVYWIRKTETTGRYYLVRPNPKPNSRFHRVELSLKPGSLDPRLTHSHSHKVLGHEGGVYIKTDGSSLKIGTCMNGVAALATCRTPSPWLYPSPKSSREKRCPKKFEKGDTELNLNKSLRASGVEIFFPNLKTNYEETLDTVDEDEEESSENDGDQKSENFIENDEETKEFIENDEAKENFYQTLLDRKAPLSEESDDKVKSEQARIDNMFLCDRDADSGISQENLTQVQVLILSYSFNIFL